MNPTTTTVTVPAGGTLRSGVEIAAALHAAPLAQVGWCGVHGELYTVCGCLDTPTGVVAGG